MPNSRNNSLSNRKAFSSGIPFPEVKLFVTSTQEVEESKATRKQAKEVKQNTHNYFKNKAGEIKHWLETHQNIRKFQKFLLKVGLLEKAADNTLAGAQHKADLASQALDASLEKQKELTSAAFERRKQVIANRKLELQERKQLKGN
jgi:hypothetical protein